MVPTAHAAARMTREDARCAIADRRRGLDVRRRADAPRLRAHELRAVGPTDKAERDDEADDGLVAQEDREQQREHQLGQAGDGVRHQRDRVVERATSPAGRDAEHEPEEGA